MKVWEDRYLNNANKTFGSNVLTVPQIHSTHVYQTLEAQSQEKVSLNTHGNVIGSRNTPPPNESVALEKHNLDRGFLDPVIDYSNGDKGRRIPTVVNSLIPKHVDKVYSGYDSLPRPRKTPSLSWAYGTRFVRHGYESSDTDCSEIDRATRAQKRNPHVIKSGRVIATRPRQLTVLESSEDERGCSRIWNRSRYGESGRLRTFTQQTYKLHSLKEEEGEADVEQRMPLTCNKLKVYCKGEDAYYARGWNRSTSFTEARVQYQDTANIGTTVRCLDGYTSSCPESLNCLSEKEGKSLSIGCSKRLTMHYF